MAIRVNGITTALTLIATAGYLVGVYSSMGREARPGAAHHPFMMLGRVAAAQAAPWEIVHSLVCSSPRSSSPSGCGADLHGWRAAVRVAARLALGDAAARRGHVAEAGLGQANGRSSMSISRRTPGAHGWRAHRMIPTSAYSDSEHARDEDQRTRSVRKAFWLICIRSPEPFARPDVSPNTAPITAYTTEIRRPMKKDGSAAGRRGLRDHRPSVARSSRSSASSDVLRKPSSSATTIGKNVTRTQPARGASPNPNHRRNSGASAAAGTGT